MKHGLCACRHEAFHPPTPDENDSSAEGVFDDLLFLSHRMLKMLACNNEGD